MYAGLVSNTDSLIPWQVLLKMRPNYTSLNKLTDKSKDVRLKIRVTHKGEPIISPSKRRFQGTLIKGRYRFS